MNFYNRGQIAIFAMKFDKENRCVRILNPHKTGKVFKNRRDFPYSSLPYEKMDAFFKALLKY